MVFKLKAIAAVEGGSKQATARQFKINAKGVREWCSQKVKLTALKKRGRREASNFKKQNESRWTAPRRCRVSKLSCRRGGP